MCGDLHGIQIRMRMCSAKPSNVLRRPSNVLRRPSNVLRRPSSLLRAAAGAGEKNARRERRRHAPHKKEEAPALGPPHRIKDLHGIQIRMRMCSAMPSNGVAATLKLVASCCRRRREERAPGTPPRPHKKGGPNLGPPCHINDEFAKPFSLFLAPLVQVAEVRLERGVARGDRASGSTGHGRRAHGRTGGRGRRRRRTRAVGSR